MKQIVLVLWLLSIICLCDVAKAQDDRHRPFLKEGKVWNIRFESNGISYYRNRISGDSIIGGVQYYKMYKDVDETTELSWYALWREEGKKVYSYIPTLGIEYLMYDFGAQPGEQLRCNGDFLIQIDKVCNTNVNGKDYSWQVIRTSPFDLFFWIEGVGGQWGPEWPIGRLFNDGKTHTLLSCYDKECLYSLEDFNSIVETGINDISQGPVDSNAMYIDAQKLFNISGQEVRMPLSPGVYIRAGKKYVVK